ncbi:poly(A) specific ribonuclease subunit PAN3 [Oratosquilla oratoria]|uniref:poly(A) specific ribonuclease subunit PAN3 n=1 Tax=Oratosquilla oratoria TaxID=337810 RepID=UPI003F757793
MMDQLFLNLALPQQGAATSSPTAQVNGLPQESKLATYISNRQTLTGQQPQQAQQPSTSLTKNLAALSLDGVPQRKPSVGAVQEFVPRSGTPGGLAHSASTPSFHSFQGMANAGMGASGLSTPSSISFTATPPIAAAAGGTGPAGTPPSFAKLSSPSNGASPRLSPQGSPTSKRRGSPSDNGASGISTYHENVGGTTYFYTADEMTFTAPSPAPGAALVFPPYHVIPPMPAHVHHLRAPVNAPHFFMGDELRQEIMERHTITLTQVDPDQFPDLPRQVDMYHELVPLEPPHAMNKSSMFGYATSVYKATNMKTGLHYCLYRIHGYRLSNTKVMQLVDLWKKLQHSSVVQLREVFTSKDFGDNSIVFVFDYHAGAETLAARHFNSAVSANGWESSSGGAGSGGGPGASFNHQDPTSSRSFHKGQRHSSGNGVLTESTLWNYIIQLTGALRMIHTQGLACRTLDPTKILVTDNKSRLRINCCGILDVLNFDPNASNPLAAMPTYQQEDLVNLGKLMVALACNSVLALQRDNIQAALELINRSYSRDLSMLVVCLLTSQRIKNVNDIMPMIGARFYTALETATQRGDVYEAEMAKEIHNGRLFRILTKLNTIVDRPELNMDTAWSETGDRYMLKLFKDYVFHQMTEDGRPWLDLGHVITVINKLDAGSPDKICLMSHDQQNILVTSYAELKRCFERSFTELLQAASSHKGVMSS